MVELKHFVSYYQKINKKQNNSITTDGEQETKGWRELIEVSELIQKNKLVSFEIEWNLLMVEG